MEIASRTLTLHREGTEVEIPISLFCPRQQGKGAWSCRYEIGWPEGSKAKDIWGIDSFQAIILALRAIGTDLYASSYHQAGQLYFENPGTGFGFPVPNTLRDLLTGDDAKYF